MNITIQNATFVLPDTTNDNLKSALTEAILGTQAPFIGAVESVVAVQSVLDAYDTANRLKQFDKDTYNNFWLLPETIQAQYKCDTPFSFALLTAVEAGKMGQKDSKIGNTLYKSA
jgi:hypothetical protein